MCPGRHSHTPRQLVQGSLREFLERLLLWCNATTAAEVAQQNIRKPFFFYCYFFPWDHYTEMCFKNGKGQTHRDKEFLQRHLFHCGHSFHLK